MRILTYGWRRVNLSPIDQRTGRARGGQARKKSMLLCQKEPVSWPTLYFAECIRVCIDADAKILIPGALLLILDTGKLTK